MKLDVKHHFFLYPFFRWYSKTKLRRNFNRIELIGKVPPCDNAVVVISNHTSWWDGFWINYLNEKIFKRKFTFLMREDQLQKHWYFKYTGGIPIKKGTRSILDSLNYCARLLSNPNYLLTLFPQGEIQSIHKATFRFEKGIEWLLSHSQENVQVVFAANLVDYFSNSKPSLYIHYKEFKWQKKTISEIQQAYQTFYEHALDDQNNLPS